MFVNSIRKIRSRLGSLWRQLGVKGEIDEELQFHLEQRTAENLANGMAPEDAAREARKRFGNWQSGREECRNTKGAAFGEGLWHDARFGLRMLRKKSGLIILSLLTALAAGHGQERPERPRPRPVLLTTDIGVDMDDQWVLAHLVLSPEFDLRGVVTTHCGDYPALAAPAAESSARVAKEVLDHLPLSKRPKVIAGSSDPLRSKAEPRLGPGVDFILKESRAFSRTRPLTVLVIGAATDVASALLADPSLAERIEIVAMAFGKWPEGDDMFNVKNDVKAWQVPLESPAPVVVADGAVTLAHLRMTREGARRLFEDRGKPGRYLAGLLVDWLDRRGDLAQMLTGQRSFWPVWDEGTVAHLLGLAKSEVHPRPRLRDDLKFEHAPAGQSSGPTIRWVTWINSDKLWEDFGRKLDRARTKD